MSSLSESAWQVALSAEETADDSDKTFTVHSDEEWQILSVWVELTTTATSGNRQVVVEAQDSSSDVIGKVLAGAVQAASLTRYYLFSLAASDDTGFSGVDSDYMQRNIPAGILLLGAGEKLRVYDSEAVAAAADDMIVQLKYMRRVIGT